LAVGTACVAGTCRRDREPPDARSTARPSVRVTAADLALQGAALQHGHLLAVLPNRTARAQLRQRLMRKVEVLRILVRMAWCADGDGLQHLLGRRPGMLMVFSRYMWSVPQEVAALAACSQIRDIRARLAGWKLMSDARNGHRSLNLTDAHVADMLGVRRASVTRAAVSLKEQGLVEYQRGNIRILDRDRLEAVSCWPVRPSRRHQGARHPAVFGVRQTTARGRPTMESLGNDSGGLMNILETLAHVFPYGPTLWRVPRDGGFFAVRGLSRGMPPSNCEKLASGRAGTRIGEAARTSYLVRTPDFLLFFRTCPDTVGAAPGGFVVSCGFAPLFSALAADLEAYARRSIAARR
jgi:hypothetical protein